MPFGKLTAHNCALSLSKSLAGLAPESPLRLNRALGVHVLWSVIDVVFALTTLFGRQCLTEFGFGLVLGCLFLAGFVTSAHEANSYR